MHQMSPAEIDAFLSEPLPAFVATVNRDGTPQLTPVWYDWDGKRLVFAVQKVTLKYQNILRDGRVVVIVSTSPEADKYVTLRGTGRVLDAQANLWRERIWSRYVNLGMARERIPEREDPPMVAIELIPERIRGFDLPDMVKIFEESERRGGRTSRAPVPPEPHAGPSAAGSEAGDIGARETHP